MPDILAENLSGKAVKGNDGSDLGMLYNITMDLRTGALSDLIVEPEQETSFDADFEVDDQGRYHVPVNRVRAVRDHILVAVDR